MTKDIPSKIKERIIKLIIGRKYQYFWYLFLYITWLMKMHGKIMIKCTKKRERMQMYQTYRRRRRNVQEGFIKDLENLEFIPQGTFKLLRIFYTR